MESNSTAFLIKKNCATALAGHRAAILFNRNLLKEVVTMWWSIGCGIIIFTLGMFIFLKPGLIWKLTEEWKSYRADEPSEFYLKTTKIGGILFALFGIIMIMLPVILE